MIKHVGYHHKQLPEADGAIVLLCYCAVVFDKADNAVVKRWTSAGSELQRWTRPVAIIDFPVMFLLILRCD
jgi:hypothetical protein